MDSVYLISLIVGGFFVLLSMLGGGEHDAEHDIEFDSDKDFGLGSNLDTDLGDSADIGFVDLLSIRALFLFAAFFGLTGVSLTAFSGSEPLTALLSTGTGLLVGLGGNYAIKKFAYEHISSQVTGADMTGRTAIALLPFSGAENGKIILEAGGKRIQVTARLFEGESGGMIQKDDQVVIVNMDGRIAEVLKPD